MIINLFFVMNCAINLFGHLSWLVMQMRKIPSGNQKSSGMRCINTKPQQGLDLSAPGVPPTLSPRDPPHPYDTVVGTGL